MSGRIVGEVLDHAPDDLRPLDFRVLIALAEDAFDSDRTARKRCSAEELAYRARSTPGSVRQALVRLRERALIRPVHTKVGPGRQQNWVIAQLSSHHREGARIIPLTRDRQGSHDPPDEHVTPSGNA
jgi:hypothetical protein